MNLELKNMSVQETVYRLLFICHELGVAEYIDVRVYVITRSNSKNSFLFLNIGIFAFMPKFRSTNARSSETFVCKNIKWN